MLAVLYCFESYIGCGIGCSTVEAEIKVTQSGVQALFLDRFFKNVATFKTPTEAREAFDRAINAVPHEILYEDEEYKNVILAQVDQTLHLFIRPHPVYGPVFPMAKLPEALSFYIQKFYMPLYTYCEQDCMKEIEDSFFKAGSDFFDSVFTSKINTGQTFYVMPTCFSGQIFCGCRLKHACLAVGATIYAGIESGKGKQAPSDPYKHEYVNNSALYPRLHYGIEPHVGIYPNERLFVYWKSIFEHTQYQFSSSPNHRSNSFRAGLGCGLEVKLNHNMRIAIDYGYLLGASHDYKPFLADKIGASPKETEIGKIKVHTHRVMLRFSKSFSF